MSRMRRLCRRHFTVQERDQSASGRQLPEIGVKAWQRGQCHTASRPRRSAISSTDVEIPGESSSHSGALISLSSGVPPLPTRGFNYPPISTSSFPSTRSGPDSQSQYQYPVPCPNSIVTYPDSTVPPTLGHFQAGSDENYDYSYPDFEPGDPVPDFAAHFLEDRSLDTAELASYLEPFHAGATTSIHGGTFIAAENVHHNHRHGETGIHILHRAIALEAIYDSADSFPQPRCHPETRTKMLDDLYNWAIQDASTSPISWLHGPAGAGKSAIMQSLCQRLKDSGRLGGTFFFKRGHLTRGNAKVLFATLAYQLALNNRHFNPLISQRVEYDPSLVGRHMDAQICKLILEPCQSVVNCLPPILLIDGRTTRAHICDIFEQPSFHGILDSVNVEKSFEDIRTYLSNEFSRIHREHKDTMRDICIPWPSPDTVDRLVGLSSGYFVYASTVIKFIDDKHFRPTERLAAIQNLTPTNSEAPFEALDQLYIQILSGVPVQFRSKLCDILQSGAVGVFLVRPLQIDHLLGLQPGDVRLILRSLHSVLYIPSPYSEEHIYVYHASFSEFLRDPRRSSMFHLNLEHRMNVTRAVLKVASDDPHQLHDDMIESSAGYIFLNCIASIPPSAEFIPLMRLMNPDFLWWCYGAISLKIRIPKVLIWLKAIQPIPEDIIRLWEGFHFWFLLEEFQSRTIPEWCSLVFSLSPHMLRVLQTKMSFGLVSIQDCRQFVAQYPEFVRILQARWLLYGHSKSSYGENLCHLRILLDLGWDDITAALSALRSIIGGGTLKQVVAGTIAILALSLELYPASTCPVVSDLALGCLRLVQQIAVKDLPLSTTDVHLKWGQLIRCSTHSNPKLLHKLHEFVGRPSWDFLPAYEYAMRSWLRPTEFYDIIQWLKSLPDPPLELIERWQSYLRQSRDIYLREQARPLSELEKMWQIDPPEKHRTYTDAELERRWQKDSKHIVHFNETPPPFDEEALIRYWEHVLDEMR
ncbi:hypothetical protein B0H13DRAFT_2314847 [Mycena leptocephala]|nr:hypothetical protein B0H13DRAFT_2314847 [Mycena leptocephala]